MIFPEEKKMYKNNLNNDVNWKTFLKYYSVTAWYRIILSYTYRYIHYAQDQLQQTADNVTKIIAGVLNTGFFLFLQYGKHFENRNDIKKFNLINWLTVVIFASNWLMFSDGLCNE